MDGETSVKEAEEQFDTNLSTLKEKKKTEDPGDHKTSLREKYLALLEQRSHKNQKKQKKVTAPVVEDTGINWGMVDEAEIYAYEDEEEMKLDPELLRELPDLTAKDLEKIEAYEKKLRKYQGLERELHEFNRREQAEFGLSEEDKNKRDQVEAKVNENYPQLQIMEDNLRYHLFDETKSRSKLYFLV